ncbi:uncharacterized protein LOC109615922 [Esox lucius]|uniref:uncharacterized protein LOC109615922 n=1 Tax=Esox lucius TaxID=8010 RepID=UPI0014778646|nr:uncharacterized protein LOC109615922 [Esox lucius]
MDQDQEPETPQKKRGRYKMYLRGNTRIPRPTQLNWLSPNQLAVEESQKKRGRYKVYLRENSVKIPCQTQHNWSSSNPLRLQETELTEDPQLTEEREQDKELAWSDSGKDWLDDDTEWMDSIDEIDEEGQTQARDVMDHDSDWVDALEEQTSELSEEFNNINEMGRDPECSSHSKEAGSFNYYYLCPVAIIKNSSSMESLGATGVCILGKWSAKEQDMSMHTLFFCLSLNLGLKHSGKMIPSPLLPNKLL